MHKINYKRGILVFCLMALSFPVVEMIAPIIKMDALGRYKLVSKVDELNTRSWFEGDFQESVQNFINNNIGFFPLFVKIHNQIEFSLFDNIHTNEIVGGKDNYLFEQGYLDAYTGADFIGHRQIVENTLQLKKLQDTLHDMGKFFMVCLAANKSTYFPEYMPNSTRIDSTNFDGFVNQFNKNEINYMNCNKWFLEMKDTSGYLLFPPYGIHWSHYSTVLVADSMARYIAQKTGWTLADLQITEKKYSKSTKFFDNDIAHALNLFYQPEPDSMLYPEFEWKKPESPQPKRKLLIVGDSFVWDIFQNTHLGTECFADAEFWSYNQTVNKTSGISLGLPTLTRHVNVYEKLKEFDAVMVVTNEPNLKDFSWGFVTNALHALADSNYVPTERQNDYLIDKSKVIKTWQIDLERMAALRGISFDSMISVYLHDPKFKPE